MAEQVVINVEVDRNPMEVPFAWLEAAMAKEQKITRVLHNLGLSNTQVADIAQTWEEYLELQMRIRGRRIYISEKLGQEIQKIRYALQNME